MCFFSRFDSIPHQWQMMASETNRQKNMQWEDCVYKNSRKRKEEKSAKSKREKSAQGETRLAIAKRERLDLLLLKEKWLARLPAYLLYLFSPLKQNGDKH
jgi:hypothetical protein